MIEVEGLRKRYKSFEALRGISFSIEKGEVVGFLGPNGAGKTTTMKILTGYLLASEGSAKIDGLDVEEDALEVRRRIGYLPESAPLYSDMQVLEYLRFICDVRNLPRSVRASRIGEVSERCGLTTVGRLPIGQLSKGYRQRVGLAQTLLHQPEIMILDEPTSGLDPNQVLEIRDLLREIGREKTIILSTHILREVEATCNRVLIIHEGEMVADAAPAELQRGDTLVVSGSGAEPELARQAFEADGHFSEARLLTAAEPKAFRLRLRCAKRDGGDGSPGAAAFSLAHERGWTLSEIRGENASLEEVFHALTGV